MSIIVNCCYISNFGKFRIVPESARWLVTQHKYEEADKILQRAAKINGVHLPEKWWDQIDFPEKTAQNRSPQRKYNYLDLVRTPRIRLRTFACLFLWPVRFNFRNLYTIIHCSTSCWIWKIDRTCEPPSDLFNIS